LLLTRVCVCFQRCVPCSPPLPSTHPSSSRLLRPTVPKRRRTNQNAHKPAARMLVGSHDARTHRVFKRLLHNDPRWLAALTHGMLWPGPHASGDAMHTTRRKGSARHGHTSCTVDNKPCLIGNPCSESLPLSGARPRGVTAPRLALYFALRTGGRSNRGTRRLRAG
jgi:hypothetical protein